MGCFIRTMAVAITLILLTSVTGLAGGDIKVNADTNLTVQNEPSITINHHFTGPDAMNVVVAYNDIGQSLGVSWSPDSGQHWNDVQLPQKWSVTGDPSVASDNTGKVYACFLSYEGTFFYGKSGIYVSESIDGGRNWSTPVTVDEFISSGTPVTFVDKCFLVVDTNSGSPYQNNVYVGWQRDNINGIYTDVYFAYSNNGGASFSTPTKVNDNPSGTVWAEGAFPFVGPTGTVYMAWYDCYFKGHVPGSLYVDISYDGGATFGIDTKVTTFLAPPLYTSACGAFKAKSFPAGAADPTDPNNVYLTYISDPDGYAELRIDGGDDPGASPSDRPELCRDGNNVFCAWQDYRNGGAADIYVNKSRDNGQTWQPMAYGPLDNTDTPGANMSTLVEICASGQYVYAVWQDQRPPSGVTSIQFNHSSDTGNTWQTEMDIDGSTTAQSRIPHMVCIGQNVYVAWSDNRNGNEDIYFAASTDNGKNWTTPTRVDLGDAAGAANSYLPRLSVQGSSVYCLWLDMRNGGTYLPYFNYSTNGGATWQPVSQPMGGTLGSWCSLPLRGGLESVGNFVYACWSESGATQSVQFNRSINNGVSWGAPVLINDPGIQAWSPSMVINGNYVHIAWHDDRNTSSGIAEDVYFDYSSDNGLTWQTPDIGPLDQGGIGLPSNNVELAVEGSFVYAVWADSRPGPPASNIWFARSADNGATWSPDMLINVGTAPYMLQFPLPDIVAGNGYVSTVWPDFRCNYTTGGFPDIFASVSTDNGATWLNGLDEADVFCVRSQDGGLSWQSPVRVNDDVGTFANVLPWIAVTQYGTIDIAYYQFQMTSLDPLMPGAQLRMAASLDNAATWGPSFILQDTIVPPLTNWVGEYVGIAVLDTLALTVFTDFEQSGNSDIYIDHSVHPTQSQQCCGMYSGGQTGNDDQSSDGVTDLADVLYLANAIFLGGPPLPCPADGNTDGDSGCVLDLSDVLWLANAVFLGGAPNSMCLPQCK